MACTNPSCRYEGTYFGQRCEYCGAYWGEYWYPFERKFVFTVFVSFIFFLLSLFILGSKYIQAETQARNQNNTAVALAYFHQTQTATNMPPTATPTASDTPEPTATPLPTLTSSSTPSPTATLLPLYVRVVGDSVDNAIAINSLPHTTSGNTDEDIYNETSTSCVSNVGSTIWFTYTPDQSELITVNTIGSEFDTVLAVWVNRNNQLIEIGCDDDTFGGQAQIIFMGESSTTYYLMLGGYSGRNGDFSLNIGALDEVECYISIVGRGRVNVRRGPGTQFRVSRIITSTDGEFQVIAREQDSQGYTWWQLEVGGWVRSDVVSDQGDCEMLPSK